MRFGKFSKRGISMPAKTKKKHPAAIIAAALVEHHKAFGEIPCIDIDDAKRILNHILGLVFPHLMPECGGGKAAIEKVLMELHDDLIQVFEGVAGWDQKTSAKKAEDFLEGLPALTVKIVADARALYEKDPASKSLAEVILAYPGCYAVSAYRIAHSLLQMGVPLLPRLMTEHAHRITGIDIHPGATIGHSLYVDHGTGVVIGETAVIGDNVQIYQGVTLGALKVDKNETRKRHPTIEDNVVIYSGATILGGLTVIGHDSIIGGNVWITNSILPHSRVMYKSTDEAESGLNWTI